MDLRVAWSDMGNQEPYSLPKTSSLIGRVDQAHCLHFGELLMGLGGYGDFFDDEPFQVEPYTTLHDHSVTRES